MSSISAGLIKATNLTVTGTQTGAVTATNFNTQNVNTVNVNASGNISASEASFANGNFIVDSDGTLTTHGAVNILHPLPTIRGGAFGQAERNAKNPLNPFSDPLQNPYGCPSYIGGVDTNMNVEFFTDIRYGWGVGTPRKQRVPQTLARTSILRGMPCAAFIQDYNASCKMANINPFGAHTVPTVYPGIALSTSDGFADFIVNSENTQAYYQTQTEDSCMIDIFRPVGTLSDGSYTYSNLPIVLFIHGGGGTIQNRKTYNGIASMCNGTEKCIVVMLEYRLSLSIIQDEAFRAPTDLTNSIYASFPTMKQFAGCCGNQQLTDCIVALEWLQAFGKFFGGDPDNITIMGQSFGGLLAEMVRQSPLNYPVDSNGIKGRLACKAICMSAFGINSAGSLLNQFTGTNGTLMTVPEYSRFVNHYMTNGPAGTNANFPANINNISQRDIHRACYGYGYINTNFEYIALDQSGNPTTDAGFKNYIQSLTTEQMRQYMLGYCPPPINAVNPALSSVSASVTTINTNGFNGFVPLWINSNIIPVIDGKSIIFRSFSDSIGSDPEGSIDVIYYDNTGYHHDTSGNHLLLDVPIIYTNTGEEYNTYQTATYFNLLAYALLNGYNFVPGYWVGGWRPPLAGLYKLPTPTNSNGDSVSDYQMSFYQFSHKALFCENFAKIASEVYKLPGQIRKNQRITWTDPIKTAIANTPETVTLITDIFDVWYAPIATASVSGGSVSSITISSTLPGFGYLETDSSANIQVTLTGGLGPGGVAATACITGVSLVENYAGIDASGNNTTVLDYSGNPITSSYKITGITVLTPGSGYVKAPTVTITLPRNALPMFPPNYPYQSIPGEPTDSIYPSQQGIALQMSSDLWSFESFDNALRSADGSSNSYAISIQHYFKGTGSRTFGIFGGAIHAIDMTLLCKWWKQPINSNVQTVANITGTTAYVSPFLINFPAGGSGNYYYVPTSGDNTIIDNFISLLTNFIKNGVPALTNGNVIPSVKNGGYGYELNSDTSGNDISTIKSIAYFNDSRIGELIQILYGKTVSQISQDALTASPGYDVYPKGQLAEYN